MMKLLTLALAAALAVVGVGCDDDMPPEWGNKIYDPDLATEDEPNAVYFTDSLGAMARADLITQLGVGAPGWEVWGDRTFIGGTTLENWWPAMRGAGPGVKVVFALGTNNNQLKDHYDTEQKMLGTLQVLREAGVTDVTWVNINEFSAQLKGNPYLSRTRWLNDYMDGLVTSGAWSDIGLKIYDWRVVSYPFGRSIIVNNGTGSDKLHYNALGGRVYACALYEAAFGPSCMAALQTEVLG